MLVLEHEMHTDSAFGALLGVPLLAATAEQVAARHCCHRVLQPLTALQTLEQGLGLAFSQFNLLEYFFYFALPVLLAVLNLGLAVLIQFAYLQLQKLDLLR
jgi:hypothetical protein